MGVREDDPQELDAVRARLEMFAAEVFSCFARVDQRRWGERCVRGLLADGARKSMEPMAARLGVDRQGLQRFLTDAPWSHQLMPAEPAWRMDAAIDPAAWVIDYRAAGRRGLPDRRDLSGDQVADALERTASDDDPVAERLAHHLWAAGPPADPDHRMDALVRAGRCAGNKSTHEAASRRLRSAAAQVARTAGLAEPTLSALTLLTALDGMRAGHVGSALPDPPSGLAVWYGPLGGTWPAAGNLDEAAEVFDQANPFLDIYGRRYAEGLLLLLRARLPPPSEPPPNGLERCPSNARHICSPSAPSDRSTT